MKVHFPLVVVWTVLAVVLCIALYLPLAKEIDGVIRHAETTVDAEDMLNWTQKLQTNLEDRGMTRGYGAIIFKTPDYSFELYHDKIVRLNEHLERMTKMDRSSVEYTVGMDYARDIIIGLGAPGLCWAVVNWGIWLVLSIIVAWVSLLVYPLIENRRY